MSILDGVINVFKLQNDDYDDDYDEDYDDYDDDEKSSGKRKLFSGNKKYKDDEDEESSSARAFEKHLAGGKGKINQNKRFKRTGSSCYQTRIYGRCQ